jgi:hypothetical protein
MRECASSILHVATLRLSMHRDKVGDDVVRFIFIRRLIVAKGARPLQRPASVRSRLCVEDQLLHSTEHSAIALADRAVCIKHRLVHPDEGRGGDAPSKAS